MYTIHTASRTNAVYILHWVMEYKCLGHLRCHCRGCHLNNLAVVINTSRVANFHWDGIECDTAGQEEQQQDLSSIRVYITTYFIDQVIASSRSIIFFLFYLIGLVQMVSQQ